MANGELGADMTARCGNLTHNPVGFEHVHAILIRRGSDADRITGSGNRVFDLIRLPINSGNAHGRAIAVQRIEGNAVITSCEGHDRAT